MTLEEWITEYGHWLPNKAIKDLRSIEPTREMLSAMMGNPLILAASDEFVGREAWKEMMKASREGK